MKITIKCGRTYQHASPVETRMRSDKGGEWELLKDKSYDRAAVCLRCTKKRCAGTVKCFERERKNVDG